MTCLFKSSIKMLSDTHTHTQVFIEVLMHCWFCSFHEVCWQKPWKIADFSFRLIAQRVIFNLSVFCLIVLESGRGEQFISPLGSWLLCYKFTACLQRNMCSIFNMFIQHVQLQIMVICSSWHCFHPSTPPPPDSTTCCLCCADKKKKKTPSMVGGTEIAFLMPTNSPLYSCVSGFSE